MAIMQPTVVVLLLINELQARPRREAYLTRAICEVDLDLGLEKYDPDRSITFQLTDLTNPGYQIHRSSNTFLRERAVGWSGRLGLINPLSSSRNVSLLFHTPLLHNIDGNVERDDWQCLFKWNEAVTVRVQVQTERIRLAQHSSSRHRNRTYENVEPARSPPEILCREDELQIRNTDGRCLHGAMCLKLNTGIQSCRCQQGFIGANCRQIKY